jgi:hypothetical protein
VRPLHRSVQRTILSEPVTSVPRRPIVATIDSTLFGELYDLVAHRVVDSMHHRAAGLRLRRMRAVASPENRANVVRGSDSAYRSAVIS